METWIDNNTGLEWMVYERGITKRSWDEVLTYPSGSLEDESWRVPTMQDIHTVIDFSKETLLKDGVPFEGLHIWINQEKTPDQAWNVAFFDGNLYASSKINKRDLVFVRNVE